MNPHRLPFWHFFIELERELSYERWIDKYKLLLGAIVGGAVPYDEEWLQFRQFIKALYLQHFPDEERFDQLLDKAIRREKEFLLTYLKKEPPATAETERVVPEGAPEGSSSATPPPVPKKKPEPELPLPPEGMDEPEEGRRQQSKFYHPPAADPVPGEPAAPATAGKDSFLLTDEYFPVTRRQMIKAWQYLRHKEKGWSLNEIDITETTRQIARDGLFLTPRFKTGTQNRADTLLIFADCRGSMTPFHELTHRLIATARGEGGHPKAPVYYFQNYPMGFVYRHISLDQPVKLKEALLGANRNFTLAIVISDAGAARGHRDGERIASRVSMTESFLEALNASCAHTIWLNPMPVHRWKKTAAESIRKKVLLMAPIFDRDTYDFQDTLRTVLKQQHHLNLR
ncbi:MAG TPA: hypothetical protein VHK69_05780 [Chitinophagaceae bacterium]|jgi:hypothetical protein|nr:hypothetical protein [Chitinophagaceae bacterium]